jgi:2',3'-cyclic-nucleotide 2'-phosphodiesterase (5'-nucleotidase family)
MIAESMANAATKPVDCAFFNSGSIRIDDEVNGKLTQADIVRILPFGGSLVEMDIQGDELQKVLLAGIKNKERGGYLQWHNIEYVEEKSSFLINKNALNLQKKYHIITNDFIFSGKEANLEFFTEKNPVITNVMKATDNKDLRADIRRAFIHFLKQK